MVRTAFVLAALPALTACRPETPEPLTCDILRSAKLTTSVAAAQCVEPSQSGTPLCSGADSCPAIPSCIREHVAARLGVSATWRSNNIDGVGRIRLFVGEPVADGYRTRMLEWTLVSGYDPHSGENGATHTRISECACDAATPPMPGTEAHKLGLGLDCECAEPATLCSE